MRLVVLVLLLASVAGAAVAQDWGNIATISSTLGNNSNQLCIGDHSRPGDIGCPSWAPSVTTAGNLIVSGSVTAAQFIGDGSGLTGVSANVSVTTGLSGSIVYRDQYGGLVASPNFSISSTTGSVGIGAGAPAWLGANAFYTSGSLYANALYLNGNAAMTWGSGNTKIAGSESPGYLTFTISNTEAMRIVSSGYVGIGTSSPSTTLHIVGGASAVPFARFTRSDTGAASGLSMPSGGLAILAGSSMNPVVYVSNNAVLLGNITGAIASPSATLHVSGTLMVTSGSSAAPALYVSSSGNVGIGTASPATKFEVIGTGANIYATSGTGPVKTGDPAIQITNLANTDYASSYLTFKVTDAATTARSAYIGAMADGAFGHDIGATLTFGARTASGYQEWMRLNTLGNMGLGIAAPTTRLEVSGTISATRFVGDGSGLTNVGAATGDRIVSGSTSMLAISSTGYISLTQAGTNTGWFDPTRGLVTIGVSSTGAVSATGGYFTNGLVIGGSGSMPGWMSGNGLYVGGSYSAQFTGSVFVSSGRTFAWDNYNALYGDSTNKYISVITSGTEAMRITSTGLVGIGTSTPSTTLTVYSGTIQNLARFASTFNNQATISFIAGASGIPVYTGSPGSTGGFAIWDGSGPGANNQLFSVTDAGKIGIGKSVYSPSATLHVSGDLVVATSVTVQPALYVSNSIAYVGIGTNSPQNALDIRPINLSTDGFVNVRSSKGSSFFTARQFGPTFLSSNAMFNAITDNGTSPTSNFYMRGTTSDTINYSIRADGTIYAAGKMAIGTTNYLSNSTWNPAANLEVSGTVSATRFVGDGSGLTGVTASTDRIVNGSINAVADVSTGAVRVSGTLALNNTGNEPCDAAHWFTFRANPVTQQMQMCRP